VTVVAVGANSGADISLRDRFGVHAFAIRKKRPIADPAALHDRFIAVATAAGLGDVSPVDSRARIAGRQDRRHVAVSRVTIDTSSGLPSTLNSLCVKTVIVGSVYVRVKLRASQIRQSLTGSVTTLALEIW